MFLADAELRTLTGYVRPSCQRAWLDRHGVAYYVARSGRPVVTWQAINGPQTHEASRSPAADAAKEAGLDYQALLGHTTRAMSERYIKGRQTVIAEPVRRKL